MSRDAGQLGPPWTLFAAGGEPISILPAGRPGTVCDVRGYALREAQAIVDAANAVYRAKVGRELDELQDRVTPMLESLRRGAGRTGREC